MDLPSMVATAVIAAATSLIVAKAQKEPNDKAVIGLLRYHLRRLEVEMSIPAYCPVVPAREPDSPLPDLASLALSPEGSRVLGEKVRELVYAAVIESEASLRFLKGDDERRAKGGEDAQEYRRAAGRRALWKIYVARDALNDREPVYWPPDPTGLHNWPPGKVIQRIDLPPRYKRANSTK